ncbi:MAG: alpha/beta hydrolase [Bryobacteraceae bacterium]
MRGKLVLAACAAAAFGQQIVEQEGLEYWNVEGHRLALDVARPAAEGRYPGIVLVHGGGFSAGNREGMMPMARKLAARGYVAASMSYRLTPAAQFPAQIYDAKAAVRFLRANAARLALDPDHIGTVGVSAGGTISLLLGVMRGIPAMEGPGPWREFSSDVQCVVNLYGRSDLTASYGGSRNAATALPPLVGGELPWARDAHLRASPLSWITPLSSPILTIHGTLDLNVPYPQSVVFHERLRAVGVESELETIEGAGHGFAGANQERADRRMYEYFDRMLKPKQDRRKLLLTTVEGERLTVGWPSGRILERAGGVSRSATLPAEMQAPAGTTLRIQPREIIETDASGKVIRTVGGEKGPVRLASISALATSGTGLWIADAGAHRIIEVDRLGRVIAETREFAHRIMSIEVLP